MPGVSGYRQNVVIARERIKGQPCGYEDLPIDGIVELWLERPETLEAAFSSPAGRTTKDERVQGAVVGALGGAAIGGIATTL
jgi:hypothetical protein